MGPLLRGNRPPPVRVTPPGNILGRFAEQIALAEAHADFTEKISRGFRLHHLAHGIDAQIPAQVGNGADEGLALGRGLGRA